MPFSDTDRKIGEMQCCEPLDFYHVVEENVFLLLFAFHIVPYRRKICKIMNLEDIQVFVKLRFRYKSPSGTNKKSLFRSKTNQLKLDLK